MGLCSLRSQVAFCSRAQQEDACAHAQRDMLKVPILRLDHKRRNRVVAKPAAHINAHGFRSGGKCLEMSAQTKA
jgi:hypothetical protein